MELDLFKQHELCPSTRGPQNTNRCCRIYHFCNGKCRRQSLRRHRALRSFPLRGRQHDYYRHFKRGKTLSYLALCPHQLTLSRFSQWLLRSLQHTTMPPCRSTASVARVCWPSGTTSLSTPAGLKAFSGHRRAGPQVARSLSNFMSPNTKLRILMVSPFLTFPRNSCLQRLTCHFSPFLGQFLGGSPGYRHNRLPEYHR